MKEKVLITGGAGFVGSHTVDRFIKEGYAVKIFDNLDPQVHPNSKIPAYLNKEAEFIKGDVRDRGELKKAMEDVEGIIHLAAKVGVGQSQYDIANYVDVNITGTANLLNNIIRYNLPVKKIIVASSMSAYGEGRYICKSCGITKPRDRDIEDLKRDDFEMKCPRCKKSVLPIPTTENTELYITSVYALTKKVQEEMALLLGRVYNIPAVALRYFNIYGPRQSLSNPYTGVAAIFISRILNNKPPVIYEDGKQSRDFVSVYDIAEVNLIAYKTDALNGKAVNVGTARPTTILELAKTLIELMNKEVSYDITKKFRKGDIRHCFADIELIKKLAGYEPKISFKDGMRDLIGWSLKEQAEDLFEKADEELKEKSLHII
ncbi:MAG: SDR family NAD(P)-dependent oxidoreductase [Candidatus Hydrogenedentota bacterium]